MTAKLTAVKVRGFLVSSASSPTSANSPSASTTWRCRWRLSRVDQNYLRADTHAAANARLIAAQARIGVAELWGSSA